jgi:UDP-N-acetylmuramate dehydrogenase
MTLAVTHNADLAPLSTLKVGGVGRYLALATSNRDIKEAVDFAKTAELPFFVLGGGSNVLVPDTGYEGVVIRIGLLGRTYEQVSPTAVRATIAAGEVLDDVIAETVEKGWWGLENLSAIPGSVGAAPVQNVGAYGVEAANCIESVTVFDTVAMLERTLTKADCGFGYRDSIFKQEGGRHYIVTAVTFVLSVVPRPQLAYADLATRWGTATPSQSEIREAVIAIRGGKFPDWRTVGTAGSFFKNPIVPTAVATALKITYPELPVYDAGAGLQKISLGYVLDKICGRKGYCTENVCLYEKQALVLVAERDATATDVMHFARDIAQLVEEKIGVSIEWEVVMMK